MFPWGGIGKYAPRKYGKYNIHHTGVGYRHLGHEELGKDVLPLCPFAHWLIHGGDMKAKAPWQPADYSKNFAFLVQFTTDYKTVIVSKYFFTNIIFLYINIMAVNCIFRIHTHNERFN